MADPDERYRPVAGLPGRLFVPGPDPRRKHPCADCFNCLWCSDSRCAACRKPPPDEPGEGTGQALGS